MKMKDKKAAASVDRVAQQVPAGPCRMDDYRAPNSLQGVPFQSILKTNQQANLALRDHHDAMQHGVYDFGPEMNKAYRDADRSRIGRPGGATFTKGQNVVGEI